MRTWLVTGGAGFIGGNFVLAAVAGFVVSELGELPTVGASVEVDGHVLTVTELDGRRVARISVTPVPDGPSQASGDEPLPE